MDPKYLTTVIPYQLNSTPDNQTLQVLIKSKWKQHAAGMIKRPSNVPFPLTAFSLVVLKAINEDSPTVPTLLTDYILKVLCPT